MNTNKRKRLEKLVGQLEEIRDVIVEIRDEEVTNG